MKFEPKVVERVELLDALWLEVFEWFGTRNKVQGPALQLQPAASPDVRIKESSRLKTCPVLERILI